MNINLLLMICSLFYISFLLINIFVKKRINNYENKIFIALVISSFVGVLLDISLIFLVPKHVEYPTIAVVAAKGFLIYLLTWVTLFTLYTIYAAINSDGSNPKKTNLYKVVSKILLAIYILSSVLVLILPISYYINGTNMYTYGSSVKVIYIISTLYIFIGITFIISKLKKLISFKYAPILFYVTIGSIVMLIQYFNPTLLLASSMEVFVVYLMHVTIENPDLDLLKELNYQREQVEVSKNISNRVINTISDSLSESVNKINTFGHKKINYEDKEELIKQVNEVQKFSLEFVSSINSLLELSKTQSEGFVVQNNNYEPLQMLSEIEDLFKTKNKEINVTINKNDNIPAVLYGDPIKIKQSLLHLYNGILNISKVKDIKFNVSYLVVGSLCRFKINTEINTKDLTKEFNKNIKDNNIDFEIVDRIVKLFEGKFNITLDNQDKVKLELTLDQKYVEGYYIKDEAKSTINKKINYIDLSTKKVLVIDDDKQRAAHLMNFLSNYNIETTISSDYNSTKKEASEKKFNLIIVDDIISELDKIKNYLLIDKNNGLLKVMDHIEYDVPRVIMVTPNTKDYESKFIEEGFDEVLTKPVDKYKLDSIIKSLLKDIQKQDM